LEAAVIGNARRNAADLRKQVASATFRPRRLLTALIPALVAIATLPAIGSAAPITWQDTETVDAPVSSMPLTTGSVLACTGNRWWVSYDKGGQALVRARTQSGWLGAEPLSDDPAVSRNPHIAACGDSLFALWEDLRSGQAEIYARIWHEGAWGPAVCLSAGGPPSVAPAVAGGFEGAAVAWQDSTSATQIAVQGAIWDGSGWNDLGNLSTSEAISRDPTVAGQASIYDTRHFFFAWADARDGNYEIYRRMRLPWGWDGTETRDTDLTYDCRRPSMAVAWCCPGGVVTDQVQILFEYQRPYDETQIWAVCDWPWASDNLVPISPADSGPAKRPQATGFNFPFDLRDDFSGSHPYFLQAWWAFNDGTRQNWLSYDPDPATGWTFHCSEGNRPQRIEGAGLSWMAVSARYGDPLAEIRIAWIEQRLGVKTLLTRLGTVPSCQVLMAESSPAFLLAPRGLPADTVHAYSRCSGEPIPAVPVTLVCSSSVEDSLAWDPAQYHPPLYASTNANGDAVFSLRGGGCAQGSVSAYTGMFRLCTWPGAKSPDVDGDCAVQADDRAYVQDRLGSVDFCADLDGSGVVDAADLAIVDATMGDICSNLVGVDPPAGEPARTSWRVFPVPARVDCTLEFASAPREQVTVCILDASGRVVRRLDASPAGDGVTRVVWDLRDDQDGLVPAGIYFARLGAGTGGGVIPVVR
jgi:hypothetical protein